MIDNQRITPGDLDIAARTAWQEARGSSYDAKVATVLVMLNRRDKEIGDRDHSLAAVCVRWRQFSGWNESDPNRAKSLAVNVGDVSFRACLKATLEAIHLHETGQDFTQGATHYHTPGLGAYWSRGKTPCYTDDAHVFFNDID